MSTENAIAADGALKRFLNDTLDTRLTERKDADVHGAVLDFFRRAAPAVPAYRQFLEERGIEAERIDSIEAFQTLPLTDKANYMHAYSLPQRCRDGKLGGCRAVAVSSGSTGQPTFWPRALHHELDVALRFEQIFADAFDASGRATLAVVCFAMGNWVGGVYSTSCCWHLSQKGYPLTVATPGNRKDEIFRVVRELAPHFEQTVLLGYPPFVKDVIDAGRAEGIDWAVYRTKLVFAGEVFSEEWRSLVDGRIGADNPCYASASLYGTADGGVLGNETPVSIAIRRFFAAHPDAARELFGESRLPTLVQYDPLSRFFEVHDGTLVVSGDSGVPLIRYHIADRGGILGYREMREFLKIRGAGSLAPWGLDENRPIRPLPFVWVFGRADFTVSYYGANVYPENVSVGLEQSGSVDRLSGKFVLEVGEGADGEHFLRAVIERAPGIAENSVDERDLAESIKTHLLRLNSEFAHYVPAERQLPQVELRPFEDPEFFPAGVKHRYTRRPSA